jgi:hypothetical protein
MRELEAAGTESMQAIDYFVFAFAVNWGRWPPSVRLDAGFAAASANAWRIRARLRGIRTARP